MAYVELVDYNDEYVNDKPKRKKNQEELEKRVQKCLLIEISYRTTKDFEKERPVDKNRRNSSKRRNSSN